LQVVVLVVGLTLTVAVAVQVAYEHLQANLFQPIKP
jgi:hypothetical protein